jgi:hypothetical protein
MYTESLIPQYYTPFWCEPVYINDCHYYLYKPTKSLSLMLILYLMSYLYVFLHTGPIKLHSPRAHDNVENNLSLTPSQHLLFSINGVIIHITFHIQLGTKSQKVYLLNSFQNRPHCIFPRLVLVESLITSLLWYMLHMLYLGLITCSPASTLLTMSEITLCISYSA